MSTYSKKARNHTSTWFSLIFFLLLVLYLLSIELFRDSREQKSITNLLKSPLTSEFLDSTIAMRFKNRIGQVTITKVNDTWIMQEPRVIPAKIQTLNQVTQALKKIKIHTIHQYEPINIESFSLNDPVIEVELINKLEEKLDVKIGLINPINNTSYMTVSGKNRIFQTNLIQGGLENLELSDFVDAKVFSTKLSNIKSFKIFHSNKKEAFNNLTQTNDEWSSKKYNSITSSRVSEKIQKILDINTHMIIDNAEEELNNIISNYLSRPIYRLKIKTTDGREIEYKVSYLTRAIEELKIEKQEFFFMSSTDRPYPYLISKSFFNEFRIRYSDLK